MFPLYSTSFRVSGLPLGFFIYFEVVFNMASNIVVISVFYVYIKFPQHYLLKRPSFLQYRLLVPLLSRSWLSILNTCTFISGIALLLDDMSILCQTYFDYHDSVELKIQYITCFHYASFSYLESLCFHINFRIFFLVL